MLKFLTDLFSDCENFLRHCVVLSIMHSMLKTLTFVWDADHLVFGQGQ